MVAEGRLCSDDGDTARMPGADVTHAEGLTVARTSPHARFPAKLAMSGFFTKLSRESRISRLEVPDPLRCCNIKTAMKLL